MSRTTLLCILALGLTLGLTAQADEEVFYALCPKSLNNPFWDEVKIGMDKAAAELGVKAEFIAPIEADASQQVQKIEALLETKVDGIGISPNVPDSVIEVIAKARAKGIPVVCFDSDSPDSERLCYVGTFNEQAGYEAGKLLAKLLPGGGKVLAVSGGPGALNLQQRVEGFQRAIENSNKERAGTNSPKIELAPIEYCLDDMNKATQIIEAYLAANPDTKGIFGVGLWSAIPAANLRRDKGLKYVLVGFDTMEVELQLIKDGLMEGVVGQKAISIGYETIKTLEKLRKAGDKMEEVADDVDTGYDRVTRENVDEFAKSKGYTLK